MLRLTSFLAVVLALPAAAQTVTPSSRFAERFAASAPQLSTAPRLKAAATVVGDVVRIGDLIDHAGAAANVPIFRSPGLGETGRVEPSRVGWGSLRRRAP